MDRGAHFYRCDFQVHTPRDPRWSGVRPISDEDRKRWAAEFISKCRGNGIDAVAITDHHDLVFAKFIRDAALEERDAEGGSILAQDQIVVFPSMELTLNVPCQALLLFDSDFPTDLFGLVLNALAIHANPDGEPEAVSPVQRLESITTLEELKNALDKHEYLKGRYIILPNVSDSGSDTLLRNGNALKYANMPCVGGYLDGSIDKLGKGNLIITSGKNREYGYKRIALFQTSDSRRDDRSDFGKVATWVKWAEPTAEALRQACLAEESRVSQEEPQIPAAVITSIQVTNSSFLGPLDLMLNGQYNALIGGRGTGKSTILEYLRWGLCDLQPDFSSSEDVPNYKKRREHLINSTLKQLNASVQIGFLVNGIEHRVRRNSETQEILLKVDDDEYRSCSESDIRELLPIQAYSQKQLSDVGVRLDELLRFVKAPIRPQLQAMENKILETSGELRQQHAAVQRKRHVERGIANALLMSRSLTKQTDTIRTELQGISGADREILEQQPSYAKADSAMHAWHSDFQHISKSTEQFMSNIEGMPTQIPGLEELPGAAQLQEVRALLVQLTTTLKSQAEAMQVQIRSLIDENGQPVEEYGNARNSWDQMRDAFDATYETAKARSSSHETRLNELTRLENEIANYENKIQTDQRELKSFGDPEGMYSALRRDWLVSHRQRSALIAQQCDELTELSGGSIRATLTQGVGVAELVSKLQSTLRGSGLRGAKLESLMDSVKLAKDPLSSWEDVLGDLEALADHDVEETDEDQIPVTPTLSLLGFSAGEIQKLAAKLTPASWLDLALAELSDEPVFEHLIREGEYIPFERASAGQQATSLLKALLNQPGPPLVIDQPEDDLDNQVVFEIVEQLWKSKQRRQLIFASHDANLVVNGDAELVICCGYRTAGDESGGRVVGEGAIDIESVRALIERVMEGGERAFKLRSEKYGF